MQDTTFTSTVPDLRTVPLRDVTPRRGTGRIPAADVSGFSSMI